MTCPRQTPGCPGTPTSSGSPAGALRQVSACQCRALHGEAALRTQFKQQARGTTCEAAAVRGISALATWVLRLL